MNRMCKHIVIDYYGSDREYYSCKKQPYDDSNRCAACQMGKSSIQQKCCKGYEEEDIEITLNREITRINRIDEIQRNFKSEISDLKKEMLKFEEKIKRRETWRLGISLLVLLIVTIVAIF